MEKEVLEYIEEFGLMPFSNELSGETSRAISTPFKTREARAVFTKTLSLLSKNFVFESTRELFGLFSQNESHEELLKRQEFFRNILLNNELTNTNEVLAKLSLARNPWKPHYGMIIVTEDESLFTELNSLSCPARFLVNEYDLADLENYEVVQVVGCERFSLALERLPQSVFFNSSDDVYPERFLREFSLWQEVIKLLKELKMSNLIDTNVAFLSKLLPFVEQKKNIILTRELIEQENEKINAKIETGMKSLTLSGDSLFALLSNQQMPVQLQSLVRETIKESGLPDELFIFGVPVAIDEKAVVQYLNRQRARNAADFVEQLRVMGGSLREIPKRLAELGKALVYFDFVQGIRKSFLAGGVFPEISESFVILNGRNAFLDKPQDISFMLDKSAQCSILTGANSGGKTTLLEHILQLISFMQIGLPVYADKFSAPLFSEVYYFAKTKGSASKGAFETLLTQMSGITPGNKTLILADEIEAVTEPGVAGKIISASADYFLRQGCFLVIATHLGQEIKEVLPARARIDGIEAKGLDSEGELIVDHNPVLGRLAHSTPELIVEKMARQNESEYLNFLARFVLGR